MALCDKSLPDKERQDMAAALFNNLENWPDQFLVIDVERPGPGFASGDVFFPGKYCLFFQVCEITYDISRRHPASTELVHYSFFLPNLPHHRPAAQRPCLALPTSDWMGIIRLLLQIPVLCNPQTCGQRCCWKVWFKFSCFLIPII